MKKGSDAHQGQGEKDVHSPVDLCLVSGLHPSATKLM